jgi:hypothetical protein
MSALTPVRNVAVRGTRDSMGAAALDGGALGAEREAPVLERRLLDLHQTRTLPA